MAAVRKLDLAAFEGAHRDDGVGRPAYEPARVLALLFYCANKRISSGPEIEQACRDDLGARVIMGWRVVTRSTVDRFRVRHRAAIAGLLPQTLAMAECLGLLDLSVVAGDGTKYVAAAAMSATVDEQALLGQVAALEARAATLAAAWAEQVSAPAPGADLDATAAMFDLFTLCEQDPPTPADPARAEATAVTSDDAAEGDGERVLWRKLQAVTRLLASRQGALAHLREHPSSAAADWAAKVERDQTRMRSCQAHLDATRARLQAAADERARKTAAGTPVRGRGPVPLEEHSHLLKARKALDTATARAQASAAARAPATKVNTTDPASRVMPGKHDGFDQRYNVQVLACPSQVILAISIHDCPNDKQALTGLLTAARANLDAAAITRPIGKALFDNGYASEENFTADLPVEKLLVAVEKESRQTQRLRDNTSTAAKAWTQMALTMTEPAHTTLYKRRAAIIEPVFAQLFALTGRDLTHRHDGVITDLHLRAVIHNLNKIDKAQRRRPHPG